MAEGKFADAAVRALGRMARENQGRTDGRTADEGGYRMEYDEQRKEPRRTTWDERTAFLFFSFLFFSFLSYLSLPVNVQYVA